MDYKEINGEQFYNMVINASNKLGEEKQYVNSLNVFPIPDGDTGTNMWMTFDSAAQEILSLKDSTVGNISKVLSKGALMGARGNSGVILSQILRGFAKGLTDKDTASVQDLKDAFEEGSKFAYKAVMRPTEGTILTIIRACAEAANKSNKTTICELLEDVIHHAKIVLDKTPDMLPQLKEANVVDAGGYGLLLIIKGFYEALKYNISATRNVNIEQKQQDNNISPQSLISTDSIKFAYCTEFFLISKNVDIEKFKNDLEKHGDSMVVVGLDDIVKVHIHTNDPGLILSKALSFGELSKIKIENMKEQHRHVIFQEEEMKAKDNMQECKGSEKEESKGHLKFAFVAVAKGEGIASILKELGVNRIVEGGQTMNPSTQDILASIESLNADNIIIMPNNKNIVMAANQAVDLTEKNVVVLPTRTIPEGITALTVFNEDDSLEENIENMKEVVSNVKTGSVTYAVKDSVNESVEIKENDILGLVGEKIVSVGHDKYEVCKEIIKTMIDEDSELITIYYGEDCNKEATDLMIAELEDEYDDLDIQCYDGKQPLHYFIVSVE